MVYFLFELFEDVVDVVLKRSLLVGEDDELLTASVELLADEFLANSESAAAAAAACCLLNTKVCSKRSSSCFISGLFMSLGLPVPNILAAITGGSWPLSTGTVLGNNNNGLRPSAIELDGEEEDAS